MCDSFQTDFNWNSCVVFWGRLQTRKLKYKESFVPAPGREAIFSGTDNYLETNV